MKRGKEVAEFAERTRPTHCPKQRYTTRKRALSAAAISTQRSGEQISAYKCNLCKGVAHRARRPELAAMSAPRHPTIEQILDELHAANPDRQPFITYPRTREDADCAEAERRKEERRTG